MRTIKTPVVVQDLPSSESVSQPVVESPAVIETSIVPEAVETADAKSTELDPGSEKNIIEDEPTNQEIELLNTIYKATVKAINLAREVSAMQSALDQLQAELSAANDMRNSLVNELPETLLKLRDGLNSLPAVASSPPKTQEVEQPKTDWKLIETVTIVKGIDGLGAKKIEAIIQQAPTLEKLMAVLVTARTERKHFAACLPKGVGKGSADELESRLLNAQVSSDTPPASEVVEPRVAKKIDQAVQTESGSVDLKHEQWSRAVAGSLRSNVTEGSLDSETDSEVWDEGYVAFGKGQSVTSCPVDYTEPVKIDWIRGWLSGELIGDDITATEAAMSDVAETIQDDAGDASNESSEEEYELVPDDDTEAISEIVVIPSAPSIQVLETLAESIKSTGITKAQSDEAAWNAGYESGIDELPLESCPSGLSTGGIGDWVRGWVEGSSIGAGI